MPPDADHAVAGVVAARRSVRAFLPAPVDEGIVRECIDAAGRAPSGGNLQPWHAVVVTGEAMADLRVRVAERLRHPELMPAPEYAVYPPRLWSPYRERRFDNGEQLYALLGIPREDKAARLSSFARNWDFFGAPVGVLLHVDRGMGPPQWADLGIWLQTLMLLLTERGLGTCAQEAWAAQHDIVRSLIADRAPGSPVVTEDLMLFCGLAVGHPDPDAPVNRLLAERAPASETTTWL